MNFGVLFGTVLYLRHLYKKTLISSAK